MDNIPDDLFTTAEAAAVLECSETEVRRRSKRGLIERVELTGDSGLVMKQKYYRIPEKTRDDLSRIMAIRSGREATSVAEQSPRDDKPKPLEYEVVTSHQVTPEPPGQRLSDDRGVGSDIVLISAFRSRGNVLRRRERELAIIKLDNRRMKRSRLAECLVGCVLVAVLGLSCFLLIEQRNVARTTATERGETIGRQSGEIGRLVSDVSTERDRLEAEATRHRETSGLLLEAERQRVSLTEQLADLRIDYSTAITDRDSIQAKIDGLETELKNLKLSLDAEIESVDNMVKSE